MNCENCGASVQPGDTRCRKCGSALSQSAAHAPPAAQQVAQPINVIIQQVPVAGQPQPQVATGPSPKSKVAAGLLGIFLGCFGVHRFYLGHNGIGAAQLIITIVTCGWGALITVPWGLIEGILILVGTIDRDGQGRPLTN